MRPGTYCFGAIAEVLVADLACLPSSVALTLIGDLRDRSARFNGLIVSLSAPLVFQRHAFEIAALERLAGGFRGRLVESSKAGAVKRPVALLHAFGEGVLRG